MIRLCWWSYYAAFPGFFKRMAENLDINRVVEVKKLGGSMLWNDRAADKDWILLKTSL